MTQAPKISVGQHSDKGRKPVNQDFHGVASPAEALRRTKGIAVALADGIGSSEVSQVASEFAVTGLLDDYYCTSEAWSVKKSVERVLAATNAWLHSRTQQGPYRDDKDRGYVCTLSAVVIKSTTVHVFHVGDTRVYRVHPESLEQLTQDHRVLIGGGQSCLSRAVGFNARIEIDYLALPVAPGDVFMLASDGVYEHVDEAFVARAVHGGLADLDATARALVDEAYRRGSPDNLTVQIVVVEALPAPGTPELHPHRPELAPPPPLEPRMIFDGWRIVRELHGSHRSHVYLAVDIESGTPAVLKTPSVDLSADPEYLERFLVEEWVARRIANAHVLKPCAPERRREYLYVASEYIEGQTLTQWMIDHPRPALETVRGFVEQIARGLQAFHRLEMLHQDLRPDNLMIDGTGTLKIIDFGAVRIAGIAEMGPPDNGAVLGTEQYAAPEYFLGEPGSDRSDLYSLAVITYQMLSGRLPYGAAVSRARTRAAQRKLHYRSVLEDGREIPAWIDAVLRKALHPDPRQRHETLSEFVHDLRHPNPALAAAARRALIERDPVRFWQGVSALLAIALFLLLALRLGLPA
jgi:serine/threonine protein phosphatase PrpC